PSSSPTARPRPSTRARPTTSAARAATAASPPSRPSTSAPTRRVASSALAVVTARVVVPESAALLHCLAQEELDVRVDAAKLVVGPTPQSGVELGIEAEKELLAFGHGAPTR